MKTVLKVAIGILIALVIWQFINGKKWEKQYAEAKENAENAQKAKDLADEAWKAENKLRLEIQAKEEALRAELNEKLKEAEAERERMQKRLESLLASIAPMPSTDLLAQINFRIDNQASLLRNGMFSLTRQGAENTLSRFVEGEFHLAMYNQVSKEKILVVQEKESLQREYTAFQNDYSKLLFAKEECDQTLFAKDVQIRYLESGRKKDRWKGRGEGTVFGAVITALVFVFGR